MMLKRFLYVIAKSSCVDMNHATDIFVATSVSSAALLKNNQFVNILGLLKINL